MLHLALAALLVGAPINDSTDRTTEGDRDKTPRTEAPVGIVKAHTASAVEEAPINDTYAFGREEATPIKLWVGYAWGRSKEMYDGAGNEVALGGGTVEQAVVQRAFVGAQADFISLPFARLGVGAQLTVGSNNITATGASPAVTDQDTGFGLQNVKMFAHARGNVLGVHGGYILDLGDDPAEGDLSFTAVSDRRDAIFVGATFDYPSDVLRLFGGIDYFMLQDNADIAGPAGTTQSDLIVFNMGAGVRISWVEVGAAAILHAGLGPAIPTNPLQGQQPVAGAGHHGSIAPYLRLSPPNLPVSLSVRAAVNREYADYGYALGGARTPVTNQGGVTAALTFGF